MERPRHLIGGSEHAQDVHGDADGARDGAVAWLAAAEAALTAGRADGVLRSLEQAVSSSSGDHEVARTAGMLACKAGFHHEAVSWLRRALSLCPADVDAWIWLGTSLSHGGDDEQALVALRHACSLAPHAYAAWFSLGDTARVACRVDEARRALNHALVCAPGQWQARVSLAALESSVGNIDQAALLLRELLKSDPCNADAWIALVNLKTVPITAPECRTLARAWSKADHDDAARVRLGFALARALEDQGRHEQAFDVVCQANAMQRKHVRWDAGVLRATVDALMEACPRRDDVRCDGQLGEGAVFIASIPRSGSSLVEQILASHPIVAAAGERDDLMRLVDAQSHRQGQAFPHWASRMGPARWRRMGARYLQDNARWRQHQPWFVDKGMTNWLLVGVILNMLPQARVVICRRDPLETCLGCYRQFFTQGAEFTYDLDDMVDYCADFDRLSAFWKRRYPDRVFELQYETLVHNPDDSIRALLGFCDLPMDGACLRPHQARRVVLNAPSAGQVRQPLHAGTARAHRYGHRLDDLRERLAAAGLA